MTQSFCMYPNLQKSPSISTNLYIFGNSIVENSNPNVAHNVVHNVAHNVVHKVEYNVVLGKIVGNKPLKKSVTFLEPPQEQSQEQPHIDFTELDAKVEKLLSNINMIKGAIALYSMNNDEASYLKLVKYINYMTELQHQFDNIICK